MFCDKIVDKNRTKQNWFIYYGKRIKLSCLLFLALSSDFQTHIFKNHSQVVSLSPKPQFNRIQKFTQAVSRPRCKMKVYLFFPEPFHFNPGFSALESQLSHYVLLPMPNGPLYAKAETIATLLLVNNFLANTFYFYRYTIRP